MRSSRTRMFNCAGEWSACEDEHLLEAWERMTTGGIQDGARQDIPTMQYFYEGGRIHTSYLAFAAQAA